MDFWIYRLRKTWLDKCLKSPVSEDSSTSNMVTESKHCWNLDYGTFIIFIDQCEENSVGKSLSQWLSKYYECLLTHWFPMTSILVLTETIFWNIFRCNYLRNKKLFLIFFFAFLKLSFNFEHFPKKDDPHSWCIFEVTDSQKHG